MCRSALSLHVNSLVAAGVRLQEAIYDGPPTPHLSRCVRVRDTKLRERGPGVRFFRRDHLGVGTEGTTKIEFQNTSWPQSRGYKASFRGKRYRPLPTPIAAIRNSEIYAGPSTRLHGFIYDRL